MDLKKQQQQVWQMQWDSRRKKQKKSRRSSGPVTFLSVQKNSLILITKEFTWLLAYYKSSKVFD